MGKLKPFINMSPGDTIRDELEYYGWEQKDLAEIMGRTEKNISQLVTSKAAITYETACQLSKVFKQSTQFWLNLDANYRQRLQESAKIVETEAKALIYRYMPIRELRKKIEIPRNTDGLVATVKKFWNIKELDFGFLEAEAQVCFRKSEAYRNFNPYYALTWLQLAKILIANRYPKAKYNPEKLKLLARTLPDFTTKEYGATEFINKLKECGVIFLQLDHFSQTYIDGASFFDKGHPVIVYTARHNRIDNFWFTIVHELGHVLLHEDNQGQVFIDSLDHLDLSDEREREADDFAEAVLRAKKIISAFRAVKRPSSTKVKTVGHELGLHPGIVAGCLQHHGKAAWTSFHELKPEVRPSLRDFAETNYVIRE